MIQPVILTIDPGIKGTGVTAWNMRCWKRKDPPWCFAVCPTLTSKNPEWSNASIDIADQLVHWLYTSNMKASKMYVEFPQTFSSAVGIAASQNGSIHKLVYLIGCLRASLRSTEFISVPVIQWKGNLSKQETERRFKRIIPESMWVKTTHQWDSIGIGLYCMGKF